MKIAYYRRYRNLTQEQLAERTGLSLVFLGHVEAPNVSKAISLDTLFLIAQALEIPAYKFLIFEDE
ncbi:helix-turn-helix transcriptional regulator [Ligaoa zhengdingensis]|uniref:helix-turn-helix domain-containing protein n=1 Tax=Ligaoa zhengdingensis TaxID=2763658 RepID=UPI0031BBA10C